MKEELRKKSAEILKETSIFVPLAKETKTLGKVKQKQKWKDMVTNQW